VDVEREVLREVAVAFLEAEELALRYVGCLRVRQSRDCRRRQHGDDEHGEAQAGLHGGGEERKGQCGPPPAMEPPIWRGGRGVVWRGRDIDTGGEGA
jgi:hypothetical protein